MKIITDPTPVEHVRLRRRQIGDGLVETTIYLGRTAAVVIAGGELGYLALADQIVRAANLAALDDVVTLGPESLEG